MNRMEKALAGVITPEIKQVALQEGVTPEFVRKGVAEGTIVILHNTSRRDGVPLGVGTGLRTKVSTSIDLYGEDATVEGEVAKIRAAVDAGTEAIMDLSVSGDIEGMLKKTLEVTSKPVGTLPLYQALAESARKYGSSLRMEVEELFDVIERHAAAGVDFLALHCGTTLKVVERAKKAGRLDPLVSFGGSHLIGWMLANRRENPLYEYFDRVLEIARKYDVTISFADGMRPGCLADSLDAPQVEELVVLGELVRRARRAGVQVMVEGPGHVPIHHVEATMRLQKSLCAGAPYFILGTLATDVAPGYDHITAAIGGALAGAAGADFICYVTPAEHLGLPTEQDVREGVIAARIAAHAADLARGNRQAWERDLQMARARVALDLERQIELAIDPEKARSLLGGAGGEPICTACGPDCAAQVAAAYYGIKQRSDDPVSPEI